MRLPIYYSLAVSYGGGGGVLEGDSLVGGGGWLGVVGAGGCDGPGVLAGSGEGVAVEVAGRRGSHICWLGRNKFPVRQFTS